MRRGDIAIGAALVVSAGLNLYLVVRAPAAALPAAGGTASGSTAASPAAVASPAPIGLLPPDIDQASPCEAQLAEVRARLTAAQPDLESRLTPSEKFEAGASDPAAEAWLTPLLREVFADAPDELGYDVACRSGICRVTVDVAGTGYDWAERIHGPDFRARYRSAQFRGSEVYLELR